MPVTESCERAKQIVAIAISFHSDISRAWDRQDPPSEIIPSAFLSRGASLFFARGPLASAYRSVNANGLARLLARLNPVDVGKLRRIRDTHGKIAQQPVTQPIY